jgi:hypothetical protein
MAVSYISPGAEQIPSRSINYEKAISRLVGRKILGKRCVNDHLRDGDDNILVHLPESVLDPTIFLEKTQWFEVLMVSDGCVSISPQLLAENDVYMQWPLWGDGIHDIGDSLWIVEERLIDEESTTVIPAVIIYPKGS